MPENPDLSTSRRDFRTSFGEVVRRADLERAAGDYGFPGIVGQDLPLRALSGDQAALDRFHDLTGLALPGVTEYGEKDGVRLGQTKGTRAMFRAGNTLIDAAELVTWILSSEGGAALARRGVIVTTTAERMSVATDSLASIANFLGVECCPTPWIENTRDAILTEILRLVAARSLAMPQTKELTREVLLGFRALACSLTVKQAAHSAVQAACKWLTAVNFPVGNDALAMLEFSPEVLRGFCVMAGAITAPQTEPLAVQAACAWITSARFWRLNPSTMSAIHGPPDPTDGTDGDTGTPLNGAASAEEAPTTGGAARTERSTSSNDGLHGAHAFEAREDGSLIIWATLPNEDGAPIRIDPRRVCAVLAACGDALARKPSTR